MTNDKLVRRLMPIQNQLLNPPIKAAIQRGLAPSTYAILETTGRRSGQPRRFPSPTALDDNTFWAHRRARSPGRFPAQH